MKINSRAKGASGEREFIDRLTAVLGEGYELARNLEQTRSGGYDINGLEGWAIEVKRHKTPRPGDLRIWWEQAVEQAAGKKPVLAYRGDRHPWRVIIAAQCIGLVDSLEFENSLEMDLILFSRIVKAGE